MNPSHKHLPLPNLQPYAGEAPQLIIGIDVGTTHSGVSYSILRSGETPKIHAVTGFPDQSPEEDKIPSIMYYDEHLNLRAAGATANTECTKKQARVKRWIKVEHFKLHLRPSTLNFETHGVELGRLPPTLNAIKVMGDFLSYLYVETIKFIDSQHIDGAEILERTKGRVKFVLGYPNGWKGSPTQKLKEAAVLGGLVDDTASENSQLIFISEGEASALACLAFQLCPCEIKLGYKFVIADAGGGTLAVTLYEIKNALPIRVTEIESSKCQFAGSLLVDMKIRKLLEKKLAGTTNRPTGFIDEVCGTFEKSVKREFSRGCKQYWLCTSVSSCERDKTVQGIRLEGYEIEKCFMFSADEIQRMILGRIRASARCCRGCPRPVWLVGGLGLNPWLSRYLRRGLRPYGVLKRPQNYISSAVATGCVYSALSSQVAHSVPGQTENKRNETCGDHQDCRVPNPRTCTCALCVPPGVCGSSDTESCSEKEWTVLCKQKEYTRVDEAPRCKERRRLRKKSCQPHDKPCLPADANLRPIHPARANTCLGAPCSITNFVETCHCTRHSYDHEPYECFEGVKRDFISLRDQIETGITFVTDNLEWGKPRCRTQIGIASCNSLECDWGTPKIPVVLGGFLYKRLVDHHTRFITRIAPPHEIISKITVPGLSDVVVREFNYVFQECHPKGCEETERCKMTNTCTTTMWDERSQHLLKHRLKEQADLLEIFHTILNVVGVRADYQAGLDVLLTRSVSGIIDGASEFAEKLNMKYSSLNVCVYLPRPLVFFDAEKMEEKGKECNRNTCKQSCCHIPRTPLVSSIRFPGLMIHSTVCHDSQEQTKGHIAIKSQVVQLDIVELAC